MNCLKCGYNEKGYPEVNCYCEKIDEQLDCGYIRGYNCIFDEDYLDEKGGKGKKRPQAQKKRNAHHIEQKKLRKLKIAREKLVKETYNKEALKRDYPLKKQRKFAKKYSNKKVRYNDVGIIGCNYRKLVHIRAV